MPPSRHYFAGDPAESTQLRIGDEVAWSDINGVYDRDDSLKENTNPKCLLKPNNNTHHTAPSQRFSGNLKPTAAPIIGLSAGALGGARRHHYHAPAMFPRKARTGGGGRQAKPAVPEPGSPKVSCFGKVGSHRERERALRQLPPPPATTRSSSSGGAAPRRPGCCGGLGLLMMQRSRSRNSVECVDQSPPPPPAPRRREMKEEAEAPAPGLGGMQRFSSGRRAVDWAAEMEDDGRVVRSGPL
ncbi:hypothetical protein PR202_gb16399 [Eleusine coracana subsp. coracana]|uniref:Uncharacterized protein n=1 Tax=Eleusine coracana subsp. coracana TaxID=191504 RepID=A0AAV5F207_ELECO|nr:hypothetical protein QOZ80_9BG0698700 [Eleusine coracana subsp. coracana]GJN28291.1 hypothetical protein PR202_gb16399 [Eleusine coracana subsp. coracana]